MDYKTTGYVHNGILCSHKEEQIMSFTGKWMELENIMLSEISQSQKVKSQMFSLILLKLGRKWDIGGTPDKGGETLDE